MAAERTQDWHEDHSFGQQHRRSGESRTLMVIAITAIMMIVELVGGVMFGSMALLADGLHMASHTVALGITAFAYVYARRNAYNPIYSFGTGKVNALSGFTGALLLAMFSLAMVWESVHRLISPVEIEFNQAIAVAVVGLLINAISAVILHGGEHHAHHHDHDHHHGHHHHHDHDHQDHNLKSAYLHVLADALTSVLAIVALLAAKYAGAIWMDATMGILGALLVAKWSLGLLKASSAILLDRQAPDTLLDAVKSALESDRDANVVDMHIWSIGPAIYAVEVALVAEKPVTPGEYKRRLPDNLGLAHIAIEVHPR
jgi:cation diffusion facilitator family transporter